MNKHQNANTEEWRTLEFRSRLVAQLEKLIQRNPKTLSDSTASSLEERIFSQAKTQDEYLQIFKNFAAKIPRSPVQRPAQQLRPGQGMVPRHRPAQLHHQMGRRASAGMTQQTMGQQHAPFKPSQQIPSQPQQAAQDVHPQWHFLEQQLGPRLPQSINPSRVSSGQMTPGAMTSEINQQMISPQRALLLQHLPAAFRNTGLTQRVPAPNEQFNPQMMFSPTQVNRPPFQQQITENLEPNLYCRRLNDQTMRPAGITPIVPDLSMLENDPLKDSKIKPFCAVSASSASACDCLLNERVCELETETEKLRSQLRFYVKFHEDYTLRTSLGRTTCSTASQTDTEQSVDRETMTNPEAARLIPAGSVEPEMVLQSTSKPAPAVDPNVATSSTSSLIMLTSIVPSSVNSLDVSIACNKLAQKYLNLPVPATRTVLRPKLIPTGINSHSVAVDGGLSIATQIYLERHRLTEPIGRTRGTLRGESILESDERPDTEGFNDTMNLPKFLPKKFLPSVS